jgi:hypothetical protein
MILKEEVFSCARPSIRETYKKLQGSLCNRGGFMKKTIFILIIGIFLANGAMASEPFVFISDVVNSFQSAQFAEKSFKKGFLGDLTLQMKDLLLFNNGMMEATEFIKPHLSSNDKNIKETARIFNSIYLSIIENNKNLLNMLENALNNQQGIGGPLFSKLGDHYAANEKVWRILPRATGMSTSCLIDSRRIEDGRCTYLTISTYEKESLIMQLVMIFGDHIKGGPKEGQHPLEVSAVSLYEFLNKYKAADTE